MKRFFSYLFVVLVAFSFLAHESFGNRNARPKKPELTKLQKAIKAEFKEDHESIVRVLKPLFNDHNSNFIAGLINGALLEKPLMKAKIDRAEVAGKIVRELKEMDAMNLPEDVKIKLFLEKLVERIPGSGFLSREEDRDIVDKLACDDNLVFFDYEKAPGTIYTDLNFYSELESFFRFKDNLSSLMKGGLFRNKFIFDLRGCSGGSMKEAAQMAEIFYKLKYETSPEKPMRGWKRFIAPPGLIYNQFSRPFDCLKGIDYVSEQVVSVLNPLVKNLLEEKHLGDVWFEKGSIKKSGGFFQYNYIMVREKELIDFEKSAAEFNDKLNSFKIVIMVDAETAGPAELFTALMVHNNPSVIVFGEPTKGDITSGKVYTLVYDKEQQELDTLQGHKNKCRTRRPNPNDDQESGGFGGRQVFYGMPVSGDSHDHMIDIGTLKLTDSYWTNPFFEDYHIKDIHEGGITPHYLYDLFDNTSEAQLQAAIELLK